MKKYIAIIILCISMIGCGKDGGLGPQGPQGTPGPTGIQGPSGTSSRTVYTGVFSGVTPISIPEIDLANMPLMQTYMYDVVASNWVVANPSIKQGMVYDSSPYCSLDGKQYKIVIIK
jgi:hypothetical protein